jgi:hypothetical protein
LIMNFEEFDSKLKFLGRIFENKLKNGWNSDNLEATTQSYRVQMEIQVFNENLWKCKLACWQFLLFGGHWMGFVPQHVEFGVKFGFLLKIYAITWINGWNMSYMKRWLKYILFGGH